MIVNKNIFMVFFNNHFILYSNIDLPSSPENVDPTIPKMYKMYEYCGVTDIGTE